jgi:hypothetical protein
MSMIFVSKCGKKTLSDLGPDFKPTWRTACKANFPKTEIRNSNNSRMLIFQTSLSLDITAVKIFVFFQFITLHLNFSPSELYNVS